MSLQVYNRKRDFKITREPAGKKKSSNKNLTFVVQEHAARNLHYDFRLELDGVLKSWAVPKGPSLDPHQKRLAVQVEDHPLDYGKFEGTIPEGEYGAGTVKIWDKGNWIPQEDAHKGLKSGALKFELKGKKLKGSWKLIRLKDGKSWLLIKGKEVQTAKPALKDPAPILAKLKQLNITNPEKIYYPQLGLRKIDLIEYYLKVSDRILEHITDRPLMIVRCPQGEGETCFYQKHWMKGFPSAVKKIKVKGESETYIGVDSVEGLLALAQFGSLEIHTWNTHFENIENPDQWVFDLDPDKGVSWDVVVETAFLFRKELEKLSLKSFVKTTGGKGLHIVVPLKPRLNWDISKKFTKAICDDIASTQPSLYLVNMSKAKRKGKIFLDYLRNTRGATAVAPYSTRNFAGATVSMPIAWNDLKKKVESTSFTISNYKKAADPWKDFFKIQQLPKFK
jgi:bifunctional non-homologous end joining protein LigD